jgi:hypothetical protein
MIGAAGSSATAQSGRTGMPLPQENGLRRVETMRTRKHCRCSPLRESCCHTLPVVESTSSIP